MNSPHFPKPLIDFHKPENPCNYVPDIYVKRKDRYNPYPFKYYFKKKHIPYVDQFK